MKKVVMGIVLILIISSLIIKYNHHQHPSKNDVFNITKKWSTSTEEVYLIREIDGKWLTIFRTQQSVSIAELQQNWLGTWKFKNNNTLASTYYPPLLEDQITWSASGSSEAYYFGMVMDPKIDKIEVETQHGFFEEAQFMKYEENRFFFKGVDQPIVMPVNISGFSKSGELIYSSLRNITDSND